MVWSTIAFCLIQVKMSGADSVEVIYLGDRYVLPLHCFRKRSYQEGRETAGKLPHVIRICADVTAQWRDVNVMWPRVLVISERLWCERVTERPMLTADLTKVAQADTTARMIENIRQLIFVLCISERIEPFYYSLVQMHLTSNLVDCGYGIVRLCGGCSNDGEVENCSSILLEICGFE